MMSKVCNLLVILTNQFNIFKDKIMLSKSNVFHGSIESKSDNIVYYPVSKYKKDHWALQFPKPTDDNFIAILKIGDVLMNVKLNSSDARGYRGIVTIVAEDMASTLNRKYTAKEKRALQLVLGLVAEAYENAGCRVIQQEIAGNNSQSLTKEGKIQIGNAKEPNMLHGHIIARGNPKEAYIEKVKLNGPELNLMFNMRGNGIDDGNNSKLKWNLDEMNTIAYKILEQIKLIVIQFENIEIVSERRQPINIYSLDGMR